MGEDATEMLGRVATYLTSTAKSLRELGLGDRGEFWLSTNEANRHLFCTAVVLEEAAHRPELGNPNDIAAMATMTRAGGGR